MISASSILFLGFLLGMQHATDPDHVAAVTTIVSGERSVRRASRIGALWGLGHTATILLLGGAILTFRLVVPPRLGLALELCVAVMLVVLGIRAMLHSSHEHSASSARPLIVGFIHGLAGSAFVAMLVLGAISGVALGLLYLLLFGAGTIAGMTLITLLVAVPAAYASSLFTSGRRWLRIAAGAASLVLGLLLAHDVGIEHGLFSATPEWTPK